MKKLLISALALIVLSGCVSLLPENAPFRINSLTAEELKSVEMWPLVSTYGFRKTPLVEAELRRRGAINEKNEEAIKKKLIYVGMGTGTMVMAHGAPGQVNRRIDASGVSEQWVYSGNRYVYFSNEGKATSFSGW